MIKNEAAEMLKLNIQLFADTADNDSATIESDNAVDTNNAGGDEEENLEFTDGSTDVTEPVVEKDTSTTKAFSQRLNKEREKILQDAEKKRIEDLDRVAKSRGFTDWKELEETDRLEKLERLGISDPNTFTSLIDDAVSKNPIVVEAKKILDTQKAREQEMALGDAIKGITAIDSDIKTVDDLLALDNYDEFYELVQKGYSLPDAYKVFAFEKLSNKKAASAAQNVYTSVDSKSHLKTVKGTQTKEQTVPDEILIGYKKNNPNMTEDEIRKHYNSFIGGK